MRTECFCSPCGDTTQPIGCRMAIMPRSIVSYSPKLSKGQKDANKIASQLREQGEAIRRNAVDVLRFEDATEHARILGKLAADFGKAVHAMLATASLATQKPVECIIGDTKITVDMTGKRPVNCADHKPATIVARIIEIADKGSDYLSDLSK